MADISPMRDYIYLDWERVRVLAAQAAPGEGPRDLSVLSGAFAEDRRFYRHEGETRSLQAAAFSALEASLGEHITDLAPPFDFASWSPDLFRDGQLVRAAGLVRLLDYPWLASVMETLPRMLKVTQRAELSALKQRREAHQITQQELEEKTKEHQRQLKDLEGWKMDELTEVVRELFGQTVRLKLLPAGSQRGEMFVGACLPAGFFESPAIISQKYGCDIDTAAPASAGKTASLGWKVLGLVNAGKADNTPVLPTGNAVDDMFERLALAVNRIHRVASAPQFPALSLTPLAIYREVGG